MKVLEWEIRIERGDAAVKVRIEDDKVSKKQDNKADTGGNNQAGIEEQDKTGKKRNNEANIVQNDKASTEHDHNKVDNPRQDDKRVAESTMNDLG